MSNSGTSVDIGGSLTNPGSGGGEDDITAPGDEDAAPPPATDDSCPLNRCNMLLEVEVLREVTLADLASFVPARPTLTGEPAGLGVVGMPTNLVATASTQLLSGRLFDRDVVVRFTPSAFRFDHGDGTSATAPTGGASWATLGQADFTPTATTHVYAARGTYPVAVTVLYSASVDFGTGWRPVAGFVQASTGGYDVRVVEVRTALVDKTCLENPSGPGC
ncbi:hypothetical protein [uncultured Microbacterium sp.]|uniref:hypothetical protein n=1 Tax=uncultured Microbacterium sp. TaxID=191216 RepID=UPI0035CC8660